MKAPRVSLWLVVSLATLAVVFGVGCGETMMIVSKSMEPTIPEGQRVAVDRNAFDDTEPQCGDIVIFEFDSTFRIYRVIGLPGETIEIEAGAVYVNGISLDEPYLANGTRTQSRTDSFEVPNGSYFLLGDNRDRANDSRSIGAIPRSQIIGKAR